MGTMVRRGTVIWAMWPSLMNWKETFTVFFSSPSVYRPTFWMNSHEVRAAWAWASTQATRGPPMMLPKGSDLREAVATSAADLSIAILFYFLVEVNMMCRLLATL